MGPRRLHQLISNLVVNALKYGTSRSVVRVSAEGFGDEACIVVENEGNPIARSALTAFFDPPASRCGPAARSGQPGLGLFICAEVAKAHGGEITAFATGGTTAFTVRLPRARAG